MKPSEYLKHTGFTSLNQFVELTQIPKVTLQVWFKTKTHLFKMLAAGALVTLRSSHKNPALIRGVEMMKTEEYHEDYGNCLFFHFPDFESPPIVLCGSSIDSDFDENYWTHFMKDFDFNYVMSEAERINNGD